MKFINTRPKERAETLHSALSNLGHQVLDLPLLELSVLDLDSTLIQQYSDFQTADAVVVVSPIAAEIGLKYYQALDLPLHELSKKQWIAVGTATQNYLTQFGLVSRVPKVETSEGMLSLPEVHQNLGKKIAFWRGIGGRTFMMEQLRLQGTEIINMLLYTRKMPDICPINLSSLEKNDVVLISSEASWQNWLQLLTIHGDKVDNYQYIVLGERVSDILNKAGQTYYTIYKLSADEIHQCILQCKAL